LTFTILLAVSPSKLEIVQRFFDLLVTDLDAALALTTEDVILDRRNSQAPWRGIASGHEAVRQTYAEFREPVEDVKWTMTDSRDVGRDLVGIATEIGIRGTTSGINVLAQGGWLVRFEGDLIAEGELHQSFNEAILAARRRLLADAHLYFVCEAQPAGRDPSDLLAAAIAGGVDVIQLREKAPRCAEELIAFAEPFARAAREHGALFFLNDEPGLVEACGADGVHVGQDDEPVAAARAAAGPAALVGLSTHSPEQFDAALAATETSRPDQISAGPVWETPTKEGRPAAGLELIEHAARVAPDDAAWFAIGGIDAANIAEVTSAGASRVVVVRAIRDAPNPEAAARALRDAL
jgi:thiamine-phosphate pyrophosphorylase